MTTLRRPSAPTVSVVMPAYNEEDHVRPAVLATDRAMRSLDVPYEIIVVNDHSTDGTPIILRMLRCRLRRLRVVRNRRPRGKGGALATGVAQARGEWVIFLDADRDLPARQIPSFFRIQRRTHADAVIGSKAHPASRVRYPRMRRIMSDGFRSLLALLFHVPFRDTQTGLKLYRRSVLTTALPYARTYRYINDLELLLAAHHQGFRIVEAPVIVEFSKAGNGRIGLGSAAHAFMELLYVWGRNVLGLYAPARREEGTGFRSLALDTDRR